MKSFVILNFLCNVVCHDPKATTVKLPKLPSIPQLIKFSLSHSHPRNKMFTTGLVILTQFMRFTLYTLCSWKGEREKVWKNAAPHLKCHPRGNARSASESENHNRPVNILTIKEEIYLEYRIYGRHLKWVCNKIVRKASAAAAASMTVGDGNIVYWQTQILNLWILSLCLVIFSVIIASCEMFRCTVCKWFHHYGEMSVIITISSLS